MYSLQALETLDSHDLSKEIQKKGFVNFFELSSFGLAEVRRYHGSKQTTRFCDCDF